MIRTSRLALGALRAGRVSIRSTARGSLICPSGRPFSVQVNQHDIATKFSAFVQPPTDTAYRTLEAHPITGSLGAEISWVDLSRPLSGEQMQDLRQAYLDYSVLVFRDQHNLNNEQLLTFASVFGDVEERPVVKAQYGLATVHDLVREPNTLGKYGEVWHNDCSYQRAPPKGALLYGVQVPPYGNDTVFCSMYQVYESLSIGMKSMLRDLMAEHSAFKMVEKDPKGEFLPYDNVLHPVVRCHPDTLQPTLFVNKFFVKRFQDMSVEESAGLLHYLFSQVDRAEFHCRVRWAPGTLTIWDNRATQHMAIRDNSRHRRVMRRIEIKGDVPYGPNKK